MPQRAGMEILVKHQKAIIKLIPTKKEQQAFVNMALERAIIEKEADGAETIEVYTDGGSRGNPGPSGGGYAIYRGGKLVAKGSNFYGDMTNNQAEYLALRDALRHAHEKYSELKVACYMDSKLAVEQMNGDWKVKSEKVRPIFEEVRRIADQFKHFSIKHVPREENAMADSLANRAMDRGY